MEGADASMDADAQSAGDVSRRPDTDLLRPDMGGDLPANNDQMDADTPDPQCDDDEDCNDQIWCNGVDFCSQRGECMVAPPPTPDDGNPCTDDVCAECPDDDNTCQRGRQGRVIGTPTDRCACVGVEDCSAGPCAVGTCSDGECEVAPVDDGAACSSLCQNVETQGICFGGQCTPRAEGPVQSDVCGNGVDDDCDGVIDGGPGCSVAATMDLQVVQRRGSTGPGNGGVVRATAWSEGQPMPAQTENLYCTARRVQHRQNFDLRESLIDDPLVTAVNQATTDEEVRSSVTGMDGSQGLRVCEGEGAIMGPYSLVNGDHGLRVSLRVGLTDSGPRRPPYDHRLLFSYITDATRGPDGQTWDRTADIQKGRSSFIKVTE